MPASAFVETAILKAYLEGKAPALPAELWIALCSEEQTRNLESQTLKGELSYTGYARAKIKIEAGTFTFTEGTSGAISKALNANAITFPANTGANEHNQAKNFAIVGAAKGSEAGKLYFYGPLSELLEIVKALSKSEFAANALEVNCE